jgi:hypothetical protein
MQPEYAADQRKVPRNPIRRIILFKVFGIAGFAAVAALIVGFGALGSTAPKAHADVTDTSVIGCEFIAGAIDGDNSNAITNLDVQTACGGDAPLTHVMGYGTELPAGTAATAGSLGVPGMRSIASLANAIGNEDGVLTKSDFNMADHFDENWDQNQISTDCKVAGNNTLAFASDLACTLDVFVFVNHDQLVNFDLPAGLKSIESQSLAATFGPPVNLDFACLRDDRANEGMLIGTAGTTTSAAGTLLVPTVLSSAGTVGSAPITVTTTAATGLVSGDTVTIAGAVDPAANGTWVVTVLTATTFTIPATATNAAAGAGGTITQTNNSPITTATAHGLAVGDVVTISGSSDAALNGQWRVASVPSTTSFTVGNGLINLTGIVGYAPGTAFGAAVAGTGATVTRDWAVGSDNDCNGGQTALGVANNGDGVVMFHVLEDTASRQSVLTVSTDQDAVAQTFDVNVVGSPNNVTLTLAEKVIETSGSLAVQNACTGTVPPTVGTGIDVTAAIAPPNSTVAWAVATDQDNTVLTRVPVFFTVTPPESSEIALFGNGNATQEITGNTFFTVHPSNAALPTAAFVVVCGGTQTGTATLDAAINLISCAGTGCVALSSRDHATQDITVVGAPSSNVLTAAASAIACDGTATSTVTAKVTDSAGNNVADGVPVNFSVVALGTANPINTVTKDGIATSVITPLSNSSAGTTVIVTAGDSTVASPVQTSVRVDCSLPLATQATLAPAAAPTPRGGIAGPDTGTGGYLNQNGSAGFPMWTLIALALGSMALVAGGLVTRRAGK